MGSAWPSGGRCNGRACSGQAEWGPGRRLAAGWRRLPGARAPCPPCPACARMPPAVPIRVPLCAAVRAFSSPRIGPNIPGWSTRTAGKPARNRQTRCSVLSAFPRRSRARTLVLAALAGLASLAVAGSAEASCSCRCLNGKSIPVCSSSSEIPPICNSTSCPLSAPPKLPQDARQPVPTVVPGCKNQEVYDPKTGRYSVESVCQ